MITSKYNILNYGRSLSPTELLGHLCASLVIVCLITLVISQNIQASVDDASIFLGPPLGETIILDGGDGMDIQRMTLAVSESGIYSVEDRMRTPKCEVTQEDIIKNNLSEKIARIMRGEEDLVDNYTLQAVDGKIIITRCDEAEIVVDLINRKWTHRGDDLSGKYFEIRCRIIDEKEELVHGEMRKVIYAEALSGVGDKAFETVYKIASGLGVIHYEVVSPSDPLVLFTLKDN
ncbi:hypothetical protein [Maridesulfovibrio frigidus]|uniref:hypothetical protein n=1 Tax=Maridesulfovibrio frigidus TaxID=340956 RepID=UPI0004E1EBE3|nr:hypothetical protein [Maridesulfovibrio frigidus]